MIELCPREPGYVISFSNSKQWNEFVSYMREAYGVALNVGSWSADSGSIRVEFANDVVYDYGRARKSFYKTDPEYSHVGYTYLNFCDITASVPTVDMDFVIKAVDDLM